MMKESHKKIIFIDATVPDYEQLIAGITSGYVVIIDSNKDGVEQITQALAGGEYESVHIISHGGAGIQLGSTQLNSSNLTSYKSQLQQWKSSLTEDADILLYGCDVAAGEAGASFVQQLSEITGADVAASDNLTGSNSLGGDWELEVATGKIDAPLAFQNSLLASYEHTLNTPPVIINEWSQGPSGLTAEWVELLVTTPTDLRNWKLADSTGIYTTFANSSFWQSVQPGTLIVIYNGNSGQRDPVLPADDVSLNDNNFRIVVAHNNSTLFIPGTWGGFANNDASDNPILSNSSAVVHDWDQSNATAFTSIRPGSNQVISYTSNTAAGVATASNYIRRAANLVTPGSSNSEANTTWIESLRGTPITIINNPISSGAGQLFGASLASNNSEILIGAPGGTSLPTNYKGAAYRYNINGVMQQTFINPSNETSQGSLERFGFAVATNSINNYVISSPYYDEPGWTQDIGRVYQFNTSTAPEQTLNNSTTDDDSEFGGAVTILSDGSFVIGLPEKGRILPADNAGEVHLFKNDGTQRTTITNPETQPYIQDARFGFSLAASDNNILIGSPGFGSDSANYGTGRAYWYNIDGSPSKTFNNPNPTRNDLFGISVASNTAGTRVLIGAPGDDINGTDAGVVYLYDTTTSNPTLLRTFTNPDLANLGFGTSVKFIGDDILIGAPGRFNVDANNNYTPVPARGAVYLYDGEGTLPTYNLERVFINPGTGFDAFGTAISAVNIYKVAIGAPLSNSGVGSVYLYEINAIPTLSITANKNEVIESESDNVTYTITREGTTKNNLTVQFELDQNSTANIDDFSLKDSGNNPIDFSNGIATITIPAGQATFDIILTPIEDDVVTEAVETVKLDLVADENYTLSSDANKTTASVDIIDYGTIVTNTNDSGEGSLRQAILNANAKPGADTITFDGSIFIDNIPDIINLTSGELNVTDDLTITGTGANLLIIERDNTTPAFRIFQASKPITIDSLTITGGNAVSGTGIFSGNGGGIFSNSSINLINSVVTGNKAISGGGGIFTDKGDIVISNSIISGNSTNNDAVGGGINSSGDITISNSTISGNSAGAGGGIDGINITITNSTISNNIATNAGSGGGGINNNTYTPSKPGNIIINNSTISGNRTDGFGGGIFKQTPGILTISNSTFSGNIAAASGGGIWSTGGVISNSTITKNIADANSDGDGDGGGINNYNGGGFGSNEDSIFNISNSIIAANIDQGGESPDVYSEEVVGNSPFNGDAYNIIGSLAGSLGTLGTGKDIVNPNPGLAPLGNYGGTTLTHALLSSSVAINAGDPDYNGGLTTDQRGTGFNRKQGTTIDIGAFEFISATNFVNGTPNPDTLTGTDQSDRFSALDSDDTVFGGLGNDRIFGGNGNDTLYGDLETLPIYASGADFTMNDIIAGGAGDDLIYGNAGNDKLYGDDGNDMIWGGNGDDIIWGGSGNDILNGGSGNDTFVLVRGQGVDTIEDFEIGDVIGYAGGLKLGVDSTRQENGDTLIFDKARNENVVAILKGFTGSLDATNFSSF
jgi:Ca2+-binding RTX toxin-like protein